MNSDDQMENARASARAFFFCRGERCPLPEHDPVVQGTGRRKGFPVAHERIGITSLARDGGGRTSRDSSCGVLREEQYLTDGSGLEATMNCGCDLAWAARVAVLIGSWHRWMFDGCAHVLFTRGAGQPLHGDEEVADSPARRLEAN